MSLPPPKKAPGPVVGGSDFVFAAAFLEHPHIYGQCEGLRQAGAALRWIYDPDPSKVAALLAQNPGAKAARSFEEILDDSEVRLVASAAVPNQRSAVGCRVMRAGKDYFTDKTPFTSLAHLTEAKAAVAETKRKYAVYYSERLHVESAMYATDLIEQGVVGKVIQVLGVGPHRIGDKAKRPRWFFEREKFGGILCDIGSHQFEQFLTFAGARDARIVSAAIGNFGNPDSPEFEDFGEASLVGDNGTSNYVRVDWFTPSGLSTWGDGRVFILGTEGTLELRKYVDVAREKKGEQVYFVDRTGEYHVDVNGKVGFRFFGELILDCLNRTEKAMTQEHAFKAGELALRAQAAAQRIAG